jgi:hypothetical protein
MKAKFWIWGFCGQLTNAAFIAGNGNANSHAVVMNSATSQIVPGVLPGLQAVDRRAVYGWFTTTVRSGEIRQNYQLSMLQIIRLDNSLSLAICENLNAVASN